jgi:hypothetical protein
MKRALGNALPLRLTVGFVLLLVALAMAHRPLLARQPSKEPVRCDSCGHTLQVHHVDHAGQTRCRGYDWEHHGWCRCNRTQSPER